MAKLRKYQWCVRMPISGSLAHCAHAVTKVSCEAAWAEAVNKAVINVTGKDKETKYLHDMMMNGVLDVDLVKAIKDGWQPDTLLTAHIAHVTNILNQAQAAIGRATPQEVERMKTLQARWKESM